MEKSLEILKFEVFGHLRINKSPSSNWDHVRDQSLLPMGGVRWKIFSKSADIFVAHPQFSLAMMWLTSSK